MRNSILRHMLAPSLFVYSLTAGLMVAVIVVVAVAIMDYTYGPGMILSKEVIQAETSFDIDMALYVVSNSNLVANTSVFVVWSTAAAILYAIGSAIYRSFTSTISTLKIMRNSSWRQGITTIVELFVQLVIRLTGVAVLYAVYYLARFGFGLAVYYTQQLAAQLSVLHALLFVAGLLAVLFIVVWFSAIGVRLMLLRSRVFGDNQIYT